LHCELWQGVGRFEQPIVNDSLQAFSNKFWVVLSPPHVREVVQGTYDFSAPVFSGAVGWFGAIDIFSTLIVDGRWEGMPVDFGDVSIEVVAAPVHFRLPDEVALFGTREPAEGYRSRLRGFPSPRRHSVYAAIWYGGCSKDHLRKMLGTIRRRSKYHEDSHLKDWGKQ